MSVVDKWAEYHRLYTDEGMSQGKIAEAKTVNRTLVNQRIAYHGFPPELKDLFKGVERPTLTEFHAQQLLSISITQHFSS